jgi:hypothetical protein
MFERQAPQTRRVGFGLVIPSRPSLHWQAVYPSRPLQLPGMAQQSYDHSHVVYLLLQVAA